MFTTLDRSDFERSRKGNLWCRRGQLTLTVFERKNGQGYGWCLADGDTPHFSPDTFESEEDALDDLLAVVERLAAA